MCVDDFSLSTFIIFLYLGLEQHLFGLRTLIKKRAFININEEKIK